LSDCQDLPASGEVAADTRRKKMIDNKNIIEEYRHADSEKRLYFFLSHRSLRDDFLKIDQSGTSAEFSEKPIKNRCRMCVNWGQRLIRGFN